MALTITTGSGGEPQATYRIDYAGKKVWYCAMTQSGKQIAPPEQAKAGGRGGDLLSHDCYRHRLHLPGGRLLFPSGLPEGQRVYLPFRHAGPRHHHRVQGA